VSVPGSGRAIVVLAILVALFGGSSIAAAAPKSGTDAVCQAASCPSAGQASVLSFASPVRDGYALITARGTTLDFGAAHLRSLPSRGGAVAAVSTAGGHGAWTVTSRGVVTAVGGAPGYGSFRGLGAGDRVVAMARTGDSRGYWLITSTGVLQAFGDAPARGTVKRLAAGDHVVAIVGAPGGYLIATADGAVRAFGRARAYGSWDAGPASGVVEAMAEAPHGIGYWLAAPGGGVRAFGRVRAYGSVRRLARGDHVVSIAMTAGGSGYLVATARGTVHGFGAARSQPSHGHSGRGAVAVVIANALAASPAATTLRVRLLSLRPGQLARVRIQGPGGYSALTGRSLVIGDAAPGTWQITARPVADRSGTTRYPEFTTTIVHLGQGADAGVPISYGEVVNNDTAVAGGGALRALRQSAGVDTLTINDPAHALRAGATLSLGVGPLTPAGLLLKLATVTHHGAIATATATTASLSDIGPQGTINVATSLSTPTSPASAAHAAGGNGSAGDFDKPYKCSGGTSASVSGGVSFSTNASVGASWGGFWHPLTVTAHFEVDGLEQSNLTLTVAGEASCSYDQELLKEPIKFTSIKFFVGPVPVVIVPTLNFKVSAEGSVGGSLTTHVKQSIGIGAGLDYNKRISPIGWFNDSFSYTPFQPGVTASLSGAIGPEVDFLIYGAAGPFLSADGTVGVSVNTARTPWWKLTGGLEAGVGVKFSAFGHHFDWGIPDVLRHEWTIAQANTPPPPVITTTGLPAGIVGTAYRQTLALQRGASPFHWSVSAGALPPGLTLNSGTGAIAGTPTSAGTNTLTVKVLDNAGQSATHAYTVVVTSPPPVIAAQTLPAATSGQPYSATLSASSGTPPYQWLVTSGALPSGLILGSATGTISGTPAASGLSTFTVTVTVTDRGGHTANRSFTITVLPPPPQSLLPNGVGTFEGATEPTGAWDTSFTVAGNPVNNDACLTAGTSTNQSGGSSLTPCDLPTADASGGGALQLTTNGNGQVGAVFYNGAVPTSAGLDVTFDTYQYDTDPAHDNYGPNGGPCNPTNLIYPACSGADGIAFALAAVGPDPSNPAREELPQHIGGPGATLGYAGFGSQPGLDNGYLGIGFDAFGNFANESFVPAGCTTPTGLQSNQAYAESVTVHGPGNATSGYCISHSTAQDVNSASGYAGPGGWDHNAAHVNNPGGGPLDAATTAPSPGSAESTVRSNAEVSVEIILNPAANNESVRSTDDGGAFTVASGDWAVIYQPIGGSWEEMVGTLPTIPTGLYPGGWVNPQTGLPYQMTFGWTSSDGSATELHEVNSVEVHSTTGS
jgi:putative Ig domain-containing protein/lectin family protein